VERRELGRDRGAFRISEINPEFRSLSDLLAEKIRPAEATSSEVPWRADLVECIGAKFPCAAARYCSAVHCGTVVFVSRRAHSPASVALAHLP
jgi:hypothetical protein